MGIKFLMTCPSTSICYQKYNSSYSHMDRDNEILKQFINFPPGLSDIIIGYDVSSFKKTKIEFGDFLPKKIINAPCYDSICNVTILDQGYIATTSFYGIIKIWDPLFGKSVKDIMCLNNLLMNIILLNIAFLWFIIYQKKLLL